MHFSNDIIFIHVSWAGVRFGLIAESVGIR